MPDAFDRLPPVKPEEPIDTTPSQEWIERFIKEEKGRWVSLIHPEWGNIQGECVDIVYKGLHAKLGIPDFEITIKGKNNTAKAMLVESRAQFHFSELMAIERWEENLEN